MIILCKIRFVLQLKCIVQCIPYAYPLPTIGLKDFIKDVHDYYNKYQVYLCGRGGNYDYCNSDKAYKQGKETVLSALQQKNPKKGKNIANVSNITLKFSFTII